MRLDSMQMLHIINTKSIKQLHDTWLRAVQLLCEKVNQKYVRLTLAYFCCIIVTNSVTVEPRQEWITSTFVWQSAGERASVQICLGTERCVWPCECVCVWGPWRNGMTVLTCVRQHGALLGLFHSPLAWLPWAPCIMQQDRDTALHDNVHAHAYCVCCETAGVAVQCYRMCVYSQLVIHVCMATVLYSVLYFLHTGERNNSVIHKLEFHKPLHTVVTGPKTGVKTKIYRFGGLFKQ